MQPKPDKLAALVDLASALDGAGRYALIRGPAVGIYAGVPRATVDVDIGTISSVFRPRPGHRAGRA
jgi:hypothetical protein